MKRVSWKGSDDIQKKITVRDIAKEAGVSPATVSRVLNNNSNVKEDTQLRVKQLIEKYNFRPNALARSLYKKESKTIGFILPDITNHFFAQIFLEAEKYAVSLGYTLFLCNSMNDREMESVHLQSLLQKQVDGVIFMGGRINDTEPTKTYIEEMKTVIQDIPLVMINGRMKGVDSYVIESNEYDAIMQSIEYLAHKGHHKIGLIGGIPGMMPTDVKIQAFKDAATKYDFIYLNEWIINKGYSMEDGMLAMNLLLKTSPLPSAVIAMNDLVAIGSIKVCMQKGMQIPKDLAIMGFDNIALSEMVTPMLSTVSHDYVALAREAVDCLCNIINNKEQEKHIIIPTKVTLRETC